MYTVSPQIRGAWMTLALILAAALPAAAQAQSGVSGGGIGRVARPSVEDWVLANRQLRVLLRPDTLTLSVEDLSTHETWGSDPWENSAGRVYLRGKNGEALTVGLGTAAQKNIEVLPASGAQAGPGLRISLSRFHSRMGPVREDRGVDSSLSLVLQIELAKDNPELTFRVLEMRNSSPYWRVETVEWPLRLFPVRAVDDDGYIVFPEEQGFIVPSRFEQGYFRYLNWVWERIAGFAFVAEQTSMPWFGARKGQSSFLCHCRDTGRCRLRRNCQRCARAGAAGRPSFGGTGACHGTFGSAAFSHLAVLAFGEGRARLSPRRPVHFSTRRWICGDVQDVPQVCPKYRQARNPEAEDRRQPGGGETDRRAQFRDQRVGEPHPPAAVSERCPARFRTERTNCRPASSRSKPWSKTCTTTSTWTAP